MMKNDITKKLLFVTTRRFWPTDSGHKVVLYYYCRGLHQKLGYEIFLYCFLEADQNEDNDDKPDFIHEVKYAHNVSLIEITKNILSKTLSKDGWPIQCSLYYSKLNEKKIREYCEDIKPDVIITDMLRLAPYIEAFKDMECKKILDLDDLLSKRYSRQLINLNNDTNIAGQYGKRLPGFLNIFLKGKVKKYVLKYEAQKCRKAEILFARLYDSVILISEVEKEYFNQVLGENRAYTVTMGCDYQFFSESVGVEKVNNTLSFVGNFEWPANIDSLDYIANQIMPLIKTEVTLLVVGKCPNEIMQKYSENKNIKFTGRVNDLREYVTSTKVFIAPILYGSGIKTKIVEAMVMGMPVITNSVGAEGLNVQDGIELFVIDSPEKMAEKVDELLNNESELKRIGEKAQKYAKDNLDWTQIYQKFYDMGL